MSAYVYMLRCADGSYQVGETICGNEWRNTKPAPTGDTHSNVDPYNSFGSEYFDRIMDAIAVERQIKGWSRLKKEALIRGDWDEIKRLAKRGTTAAQQVKPSP
jgi:putative endonuclease